MSKYVCTICGYTYDESNGTPFNELPDDWKCPLCGAAKALFEKVPEEDTVKEPAQKVEKVEDLPKYEDIVDSSREVTPEDMAILCANLSRACEKQYLSDEQKYFKNLQNYYESLSKKVDGTPEDLLKLLQDDTKNLFANADDIAKSQNDRGAMRALLWGTKSTKIAQSVLSRYLKEGAGFIENSKVFVCSICGFIYVGDEAPDVCPVCKVPKLKFMEVR